MKSTGKWLLLGLCLACSAALADLTATVDREQVAMGDSLRLTITATDSDTLDGMELAPLLADFEILSRSTSSNTSILNGRTSHTRQMLLDLLPRREGRLQIPPLTTDSGRTAPLPIRVEPAPQVPDDQEVVLFDAELDRDQVYVQGQLILTLRLQQAVNLDSRSISELKLDDAFVKPLEQRSFQRTANGRPWLVHEIRYAIFPEHSGELVIPPQTFSARESLPRRSLFDLDRSGRAIRRTTGELRVEVLPRPPDFTGNTWLPARDLRIEERWSVPPDALRVGESATRTLHITGEGLQGAQLPPVLFPAVEGLKFYPDQPVIEDRETESGLQGFREDSAALVPTREGLLTLPEIRIPWWDTERQILRYAVVPAREIKALPALTAIPPVGGIVQDPAPLEEPAYRSPDAGGYWRWLALASSAGWLSTLLYLLFHGRKRQPGAPPGAGAHAREPALYRELLQACRAGRSREVRGLVLDWCSSLESSRPVTSIREAAALFADPELERELASLERAMYAKQPGEWNGAALAELVKRLRGDYIRRRKAGPVEELALYPSSAVGG